MSGESPRNIKRTANTQGGDSIGRDQNKLEVGGDLSGTAAVGNQNTINVYYQTYRQVEGAPALDEEAFQRFLSNYLTWVANYYDRARLFGLERLGVNEGRPSRSLQDVFIPISLCRIKPPRQEELEERLGSAPDREGLERIKAYLSLVSERQKGAQNVSLRDLLAAGQRLAIIGGPGCGKSTLLNYLAVRLARHIHEGSALPFRLPAGQPAPVPLVIPLRGYREYRQLCRQSPQRSLDEPHTGTLTGYILHSLNHYGGRMGNFTADGFERLMLGGRCLIMLDGLDEIVDRKERGRVREEVENLAAGYPGNQFLVTAREAGFQENAIFSDRFTRLDVQPLEEGQIRELVGNWCGQLYPGEEDARAGEIVAAISEINARRSDKELPPLVTTPLMVTMVVGVKWSRTQLPRERAKLYDAAVEVILQLQYTLDDAAREQLAEWGGTLDEQREWLWTLAFEMHRGGKASAAVSQERIREILLPRLGDAALTRFIEAVHERGGLLEERVGLFQFAHLTFQEFLAARCIVDRRLGQAELSRYAGDAWWREVLLLAYGYAVYAAPGYARSFLELLSDLPGEKRLAGLELAASAVLEIEKPNPALRLQQAQRLVAVVTNPALSFPPVLRARAGDTLARLGDPRPEVMTIEEMPFCFIPGSAFRMGDDRKNTLDLPAFWLAQYPVTQAQFEEFWTAGGYREKRYWPEAIEAGYWMEAGFKGSYDNEPRGRPVSFSDPFGLPNHPVVGVSWYEAAAFCRWLDELAHTRGWLSEEWQVRLPGEKQWEKAARGGKEIPDRSRPVPLNGIPAEPPVVRMQPNPLPERAYPWGETFDPEYANTLEGNIRATSVVGCFPGGAGPYGNLDLSGNVWDWCAGWSVEGKYRVLCGGSWHEGWGYARCAYRYGSGPDGGDYYLGFRCVLSR